MEYPYDAKEHLALATERLEAMRARAGHGPNARWTVSGMVDDWKKLVDQVERGYEEMIYEYTNDLSVRGLLEELSVRGLLEELIDALPAGSVRLWVTQEVEATDARYRGATREVQEPIHGGSNAPWWYWRVPKILVGELREDLEDPEEEMPFADRLNPGTAFTTGEGVSVGIMRRPEAEVEELGLIQGPLFVRAQRIADAYELHVLRGIEFYGESALVKAQCKSLVDEISFVSAVVNDDLLRDELRVLREAALRCARSPSEALLILAGP